METIEGSVSNIQQHAHVTGDDKGSSTSYVVIMKIDGQPIKLSCASPAVIVNGDTVKVAGKRKGGVFEAYAYRNMSNNSTGGEPRFVHAIVSVVLTCIAFFVFQQVGHPGSFKPLEIGVFAGGVGILSYLYGITFRSFKAHAAIK